jgi:hypothetical protein
MARVSDGPAPLVTADPVAVVRSTGATIEHRDPHCGRA